MGQQHTRFALERPRRYEWISIAGEILRAMHQGKSCTQGNSVTAVNNAADAQRVPSTLYVRSSPSRAPITRAIRMHRNRTQRTRWRRTALSRPQRCKLDPVTTSHAWSTHRAIVRLVGLLWMLLVPGIWWG